MAQRHSNEHPIIFRHLKNVGKTKQKRSSKMVAFVFLEGAVRILQDEMPVLQNTAHEKQNRNAAGGIAI
jgi:hypothetical protein